MWQKIVYAGLGLRISEILGLTWDNINFEDNTVTVEKIIVRNEGKVILDVRDEEKKNLTIEKLLQKFSSTDVISSDQLVLAK